MICPWMKCECPGQDNCAPATFSAIQHEDGRREAKCPITNAIDTVGIVIYMLEPVLQTLTGMAKKPTPTVDELGMDGFIKNVIKPDQTF